MNFPKRCEIKDRTSSITNSFAQAIVPRIKPTPEELTEALQVLGMTRDSISCVYCGSATDYWDHLRPLVANKRPTGYITEIRNLVPSCHPCNSSKGRTHWRTWISGDAQGSPRTKRVTDLAERIERLERFERWGEVQPLPFRELVGAQNWDALWSMHVAIERQMRMAQEHATLVRAKIGKALAESRSANEAKGFYGSNGPRRAVGPVSGCSAETGSAEPNTRQQKTSKTFKNIRECAEHYIKLYPNARNRELADQVREHFPNANTSAACIAWYKNKLKKKS